MELVINVSAEVSPLAGAGLAAMCFYAARDRGGEGWVKDDVGNVADWKVVA